MRKQGKRRRIRQRRRPINVAASVITTCGLYCGLASIFASISKDFDAAAYWIMAAMFLDIFDGAVARMTNSVSAFGKELDSLCDLVAFGVAPGVLVYMAYVLPDQASLPVVEMIAIVFVICGTLRLARYNVFQSDRRDSFVGLPIPAAGGTIAAFALFTQYFEMDVPIWLYGPLTVGLAGLMVSTILYPRQRMKVFFLPPKHAFPFLVLCGVGIAVFHYARYYSPSIVLLPMALAYIGFGLSEEGYRILRRRERRAAVLGTPAATSSGDASPVAK